MSIRADAIAQQLDGQVIGNPALELHGFAPADKSRPGDLTFAENATYFARACQSAASAILVDNDYGGSTDKTLIRVDSARIAFARVLPLFFPEPKPAPGVHSSSVIDPTATIDPSAYVGPHCVVEANTRIGPGCVLHGGNHVGPGCVLGADCHLFPRVVLYSRCQLGDRVRIHAGTVVGSDGFGYVLDNGHHRKVPQVGQVIIQDDAEIGSNVTIDRGALGSTIIGRGTKVDNLVQIAHNVTFGEHCLVVAQVGVAGSTKLGNYVTLGGQVGLSGHLKIGNRAAVAAQSGVMHDIPDGEKWFGYPAQPDRRTKRQILAIQQLPQLLRRVTELERKLQGSNSNRRTSEAQ
jgi:UDP-3-O-[3-hydroxymyristoyl] glucosamine N-acyltransferase